MAKYASTRGGGILSQYEQKYAEAKSANEQRYKQGMDLLDQAIQRYQPGGSFGAGAMAQYEQGKTQAMSSGQQNLISSGLSNTTIGATLPLAYEQEVGTPFRLQLEDLRMKNLTEAERAKTGFIESRQDPYPDIGSMMQYQAEASSGGGTSYNDSSFLDTWGQPDPSVSARNAESRAASDASYAQTQANNAAATKRLADARNASQTQYQKGSGSSMSDADFQQMLDYNINQNKRPTINGTVDQPPLGSGPQLPTKGTTTTKPTATTTGYGSLNDWMNFSY